MFTVLQVALYKLISKWSNRKLTKSQTNV